MNPIDNTELIEAYLNDTLNQADKTAFEQRLKTDPEWRKEVLTVKFVQEVFKRFPLLKAQEIANQLGEDLFPNEGAILNPTTLHSTYSLEELLDMFRPIEHLELESARRSTSAGQNSLQHRVMFPLPEIECAGNQLTFEINPPLEVSLEIVIHDNREQEVTVNDNVLLPNTGNQTLNLPLNMLPGRYYWQISPLDFEAQARYGTATGSFFIRKDLMVKGE
jgi:hypothetical protein